jgi:hypothetical protein
MCWDQMSTVVLKVKYSPKLQYIWLKLYLGNLSCRISAFVLVCELRLEYIGPKCICVSGVS